MNLKMIPSEIDLEEYIESLRQVIESYNLKSDTPELDRYLLNKIDAGMNLGMAVLEDTWGKVDDSEKTADYLYQQIMVFLTATLEVRNIMSDMNITGGEKKEDLSKDFEETARNYVLDGRLFKHIDKTVDILEKYISPFTLWWIETEYVESVTDPTIKLFDNACNY